MEPVKDLSWSLLQKQLTASSQKQFPQKTSPDFKRFCVIMINRYVTQPL